MANEWVNNPETVARVNRAFEGGCEVQHGQIERSPREHVASIIEDAVAKGYKGEHILMLIERFVTGYDTNDKRIKFFYAGPVQIESSN